jgi:hypothetical protein
VAAVALRGAQPREVIQEPAVRQVAQGPVRVARPVSVEKRLAARLAGLVVHLVAAAGIPPAGAVVRLAALPAAVLLGRGERPAAPQPAHLLALRALTATVEPARAE